VSARQPGEGDGGRVRVVLASASPRRAALLEQIGVPFSVRVAHIDETPQPGEQPGAYVERLALAKAMAVSAPGQLSLGADTTVVVGAEMLGKPAGRDAAVEMLARLSARTHQVVTGVGITNGLASRCLHVSTDVTFRTISTAEAIAYWETGEPADKAGGYGIQGIGGIFAQSINGSYSAVVGLPLTETEALLREFGAETWRLSDV
jgi:septum formation protein